MKSHFSAFERSRWWERFGEMCCTEPTSARWAGTGPGRGDGRSRVRRAGCRGCEGAIRRRRTVTVSRGGRRSAGSPLLGMWIPSRCASVSMRVRHPRTGAPHGPSGGNAWPSGAGRRPGPPRARVVPHQAACGRSGRPCARCAQALSGGGGQGFAPACAPDPRPARGCSTRPGVRREARADALCRAPFIEKQQLQRPSPCKEERTCPTRNALTRPSSGWRSSRSICTWAGRFRSPAAPAIGSRCAPRSFGAWFGAVSGSAVSRGWVRTVIAPPAAVPGTDGLGLAAPAVTVAAETYQGAGLLLMIALFGSNSRYGIGIVI